MQGESTAANAAAAAFANVAAGSPRGPCRMQGWCWRSCRRTACYFHCCCTYIPCPPRVLVAKSDQPVAGRPQPEPPNRRSRSRRPSQRGNRNPGGIVPRAALAVNDADAVPRAVARATARLPAAAGPAACGAGKRGAAAARGPGRRRGARCRRRRRRRPCCGTSQWQKPRAAASCGERRRWAPPPVFGCGDMRGCGQAAASSSVDFPQQHRPGSAARLRRCPRAGVLCSACADGDGRWY
jgi:hypothetical protein